MARRKRGKPVHGWVVVDKPVGPTSTQVVGIVRRVFDAQKVGHAGTLDPLASGLLPIALGEATKTVSYVMDGEKVYDFTVRWGVATDTDDGEGRVLETSDARPGREEIEAALPRFRGRIVQRPPTFSAIKIQGERAYDLAREGQPVEPEPREVEVFELELLEMPDADHALFRLVCGKGAYVRALARDLGAALGCLGHVEALRRTAVGPFTEADAIPLETLEGLRHSPAAFEHLLPVETALDDIPALALTESEAGRLRCGQAVSVLNRGRLEQVRALEAGAMVCAMADGRPVALVRYEAGGLHPVRVLNL